MLTFVYSNKLTATETKSLEELQQRGNYTSALLSKHLSHICVVDDKLCH